MSDDPGDMELIWMDTTRRIADAYTYPAQDEDDDENRNPPHEGLSGLF
jgi:hypothetical protein